MAQDVMQMNQQFIYNALERNFPMANVSITQLGQLIDIELDSVPGYASSIDLSLYLNINLAYTVAPSLSQFAPYNFFNNVQISLGGGPFQRVSPYFYYLREIVMNETWTPDSSLKSFAYSSTTEYSLPAVAAGDNFWRFNVRVPLQTQYGSVKGLLPLGTSSVKAKIRLTVASTLHGTDQYLNPLYGGTAVTATLGTAQTSYITPNINFFTTPATRADVPNPMVGHVLNVQERATAFVGAGALTPIKFPDPFRYLRLWHIVIDGTGAPVTTPVTNFELDLSPGYPQYNYNSVGSLQSYFYKSRRAYGTDLPTGVFVFDLWGGNDPKNPNGTQTIDGTIFQTLQTQLAVTAATNVASPAKIITFAEALSPVNF